MLRIAGLTPLTTIDYPDGYLAAVLFCQGCPWRCGYCHNPELLPPLGKHEIAWEKVLEFLKNRRGLLDAIVYSGGEPTAQTQLETAIKITRELGFKIGLHTAGMYPKRLKKILPLIDWVGMDIKGPFDRYDQITGVSGSGKKAKQSLQFVSESGVAYEFRTTIHPLWIGEKELLATADMLSELKATHYVVQEFRQTGCADKKLRHITSPSLTAAYETIKQRHLFQHFQIRYM